MSSNPGVYTLKCEACEERYHPDYINMTFDDAKRLADNYTCDRCLARDNQVGGQESRDSTLKDMAAATKKLDRSEEAIEAINSFRHLCSRESQNSLNNIVLESYKSCGRIQNQIHLLESRIKHIEDVAA